MICDVIHAFAGCFQYIVIYVKLFTPGMQNGYSDSKERITARGKLMRAVWDLCSHFTDFSFVASLIARQKKNKDIIRKCSQLLRYPTTVDNIRCVGCVRC